jgi:beta-lactamase regulating signal transducer with metallopeptidase domain
MAWWIFQNLVVTAAMALVVMLVCRAGRIGPVARHALWVLVLVKFVTPPLVVWPWAAPDPLGLAAIEARADTWTGPVTDAGALAADPIAGAAGGIVPSRTRHDDSADRPAAQIAASAWPWFLGLWSAGSLLMLGIETTRLARLTRCITAAPPVDPAIGARAAALSARLGMRPVAVAGVAGQSSPVVWGLGRPRVLWPADLAAPISEACLDGLLMHELAHVRRRDHLVGWIELAAGVVWWWNPLFWYVRSALREQAELACDAWVVSALPDGRRAYAESLLTLSGAGMRGVSPVAVVGVRATSRRVLERRLVMIMKGRAPLRLPWAGLCALGLMASATLPAWATSPQQQTPPPAAAPVVVVAPPQVKVPPAQVKREKPVLVEIKAKPVKVRQSADLEIVKAAKSRLLRVKLAELPADGQQLLDRYSADLDAIQEEAARKIEARREALLKSLQDLQEQYTKAGKLDEAVAIRDYIKAGLPGTDNVRVIKR